MPDYCHLPSRYLYSGDILVHAGLSTTTQGRQVRSDKRSRLFLSCHGAVTRARARVQCISGTNVRTIVYQRAGEAPEESRGQFSKSLCDCPKV
jgi:hypothetical protein